MCGISGIFLPGGETPSSALVESMSATLRHRGPDDTGIHLMPGIGLGHNRLQIIDIARGHQPLSNEDGTIWVLLNGEIYNYLELRGELLEKGHKFRTASDTEVIAHLYEEVGEGVFQKLCGMFAIAIWDSNQRKLLLARDRIGEKPLHYAWAGGNLYFASEIKALLAHQTVSRETDPEALADYFALAYIPSPKSIYKAVRKIRPAHYMVVTANGTRESEYWDLRFDQPEDRPVKEWCDILQEQIFRATRQRLISEVPLGAFLSGGLDSSSIVASMALQTNSPVVTCAVGFNAEQYDEREYARLVSDQYATCHHESVVTPSAADLIPLLARHFDEPFADSSAIPTYFVCQAARKRVTVALGGDGGDEVFAGYRRYRFDRRENVVRSLLPSAVRSRVFGPLGRIYPGMAWAPRLLRAKATLQNLALSPIGGYFNTMSIFRSSELPRLFSPDFQQLLGGYSSLGVVEQHYNRCRSDDPLSRIQYVDIKTYLADDILVKVDRTSMAVALEVRAPLLDHELMETAARIPSCLKLRGSEGKFIFKETMGRHLPSRILKRPKQGFSMPVAEWFRSSLKEFAWDRLFHEDDGILNRDYVRTIWNEHQRREYDRSAYLWALLMYQEWKHCSIRSSTLAERA